jgi:hypothetical protein
MELKRQGRWLIHEFDSLWDFTDALLKYRYVSPSNPYKAEFIQMARHGWDEEMDLTFRAVEGVMSKLTRDRVIDLTFRTAYDVAGGAVDVGRFVSGEPECMISYPLEAYRAAPVITIVSCMSLGFVSRQEVLAQGRAVVALVRAIEATGHKVELWSDNVTTFGGKWQDHPRNKMHTVKVLLKGANDVLDDGQMIFALANYGMGRDLGATIFPQLDGRIDDGAMERAWNKLPGKGAGAADPCPDLYPEGALLLPKPHSAFAEAMGYLSPEYLDDENMPTGNWDVPEQFVERSTEFVMEHMRKLGLIEQEATERG